MRGRFGLRIYLAAAFAIIAIATGMAFGILAGRAIGAGMELRIVGIYQSLGNSTGHAIDDEVLDRTHDVQALAAMLGTARDQGLADDGPIAVRVLQSSGACGWALIADLDGRVVAASGGAPQVGQSVAGEAWFRKAIDGPAVVDWADRAGLPPPVLLAQSVRDGGGRPFAVMACSLQPFWVQKVASRFVGNVAGTAGADLFVLDSVGRIVLAPMGYEGGRLPTEIAPGVKVLPYHQADLVWPDGRSYFTVVTELGLFPVAGLDWRMVVRRDSVSALAPIAEMHRKVVAFGVGLALLAALAGALAAHRILAPLRRIATAATRIGGGEFGLHIPEIHAYREVEMLSTSLRAMLASLRANEARLAALNENLDQRVRQRTSEIAEAHEALARNESRLRAVIETALDGVVIVDDQGRIEIFNAACERMFGWRSEEMIGRTLNELLADEARALRDAQLHFDDMLGPLTASDADSGKVHTLRGRRRDGSAFPLEISLSRTAVQGGPIYVAIMRDVTETVRARDQMFAFATQDPLTGLRNRRYFLEAAEAEFARARRHGRGFALLLLDVDHFKQVNDTYGHAGGDQTLKALAEVCNRSLREVDIVGRLGGEEFTVAMPETDLATARQVAERLREQIANCELASEGRTWHITVSIGVTTSAPSDLDLDQTLRRADQALYAAKEAGRNRVTVADPGRPDSAI